MVKKWQFSVGKYKNPSPRGRSGRMARRTRGTYQRQHHNARREPRGSREALGPFEPR